MSSPEMNLTDQSVSVVIATRDRPVLLRRAIDAVLSQEHAHPIEIVVVFDHSEPDHSLETSDDMRRVLVMTNDHVPGLAGARNSGIAKTSHNWVAFCDDDDEWLEGKLQAQFAALIATPGAGMATTGVLINYQDEDTARIPDPAKMSFDGFLNDRMTEVHPSSFLVNRAILVNEIGEVDEMIPGSYAEDYDFLLRAAKATKIAVAAEPLVRVYWHGASFFFERWKTIDEALQYLLDKYPEFADHPKGRSRITGQQAVAKAAMGNRKAALNTIVTTLKGNPFEKRVPVALAVAAGLPASTALKAAHKLGKGI